jgi:hypothetical protein
MNTKTLTGAKRMTRKEFWAESDRLLKEAQGFLEEAKRNSEESERIAQKTRLVQEDLRRLLCGKS